MPTVVMALAQAPAVGAADSATAGALRAVLATAFVLGLLGLCAWLLRRGTLTLPGRRAASPMRVESAVPLGDRRSLVVVAVEGRRLLLGLTPVQVSLVAELAPQPAAVHAEATFERALAASLHAPQGGVQ